MEPAELVLLEMLGLRVGVVVAAVELAELFHWRVVVCRNGLLLLLLLRAVLPIVHAVAPSARRVVGDSVVPVRRSGTRRMERVMGAGQSAGDVAGRAGHDD